MIDKKYLTYLLVLLSATLYGTAYLFPHYCWWGTLLFLIPLFYGVTRVTFTWVDGIMWSSIAFSLHLSGVLEGLFFVAQGTGLLRLAPAVLVLALAIVYGTIWFYGTCVLTKKMASSLKTLCWVISTFLFFLWMEHLCIFMLGVCEGYLLFNPLVPLVQFPALLYFLPKIGGTALLLMLITTQAVAAQTMFDCRMLWACLLLTGFWGTGTGLWYLQKSCIVDYSTVTVGNVFFKKHDNITYGGRVIRDYCKALLKKYPDTEIIFFPESAFRCPILPGEAEIVSLLADKVIQKPVTLITGGFRWDNGIYRNTIYWIHNGKLIDIFDKRHAMALTERAPTAYFLGRLNIINKNYFKEFVGISPHTSKRPVWNIAPGLTMVPYICSELFFNTYPDHLYQPNLVLVALCNDNWLPRDYMRWQMVMGARYRAIQWQIPILYVAHFYQCFCGPHGEYKPLRTFM